MIIYLKIKDFETAAWAYTIETYDLVKNHIIIRTHGHYLFYITTFIIFISKTHGNYSSYMPIMITYYSIIVVVIIFI